MNDYIYMIKNLLEEYTDSILKEEKDLNKIEEIRRSLVLQINTYLDFLKKNEAPAEDILFYKRLVIVDNIFDEVMKDLSKEYSERGIEKTSKNLYDFLNWHRIKNFDHDKYQRTTGYTLGSTIYQYNTTLALSRYPLEMADHSNIYIYSYKISEDLELAEAKIMSFMKYQDHNFFLGIDENLVKDKDSSDRALFYPMAMTFARKDLGEEIIDDSILSICFEEETEKEYTKEEKQTFSQKLISLSRNIK